MVIFSTNSRSFIISLVLSRLPVFIFINISWICPRIDAKTLLKSWTTPQAISPRAVTFSSWTSSSFSAWFTISLFSYSEISPERKQSNFFPKNLINLFTNLNSEGFRPSGLCFVRMIISFILPFVGTGNAAIY